MSDAPTNAKTPREFWIGPQVYDKPPVEAVYEEFEVIHVIEASYAKELEAEIERLKRLLEVSEEDYSRYIRSSAEKLAVAEAAILLMKKHNDNLHKKGNVPWGQTFGIDFALMNEALIAQDKALALIRGNKNG